MVRAAYPAMELIGWFVIVPCCVAALLTGLVQALGTEWGLFRYYWIVAKFLLTIGATIILLLHMPAVSRMSGVAAEATSSSADLGALRHPTFVVHAGGGLLVLLGITAISVYKPWGMTRYGRRKVSQPIPPQSLGKRSGATTGTSWGLYVVLGIIGLILLFLILHLTGGGMPGH